MAASPKTKQPSPEPQLRVVSEGAEQPDLADLLGKEARARRRTRLWRWVLPVLALAIAGYAAWSYLGRETGYTFTTTPVARGDLTVLVTATGTVQPVTQVDVSSAISGTIRKLHVDYNSEVRSGDVLAELETATLDATVAAARARIMVGEASVARAETSLEAARKAHERQVALFQRRLVSDRDLETAVSTLDTATATLKGARAEVEAANADLNLAETNRAHATITSPIDGVVLSRNVSEGSTVAASLQAPVLFTIAGDLRSMEVQVDVDEADIGGVSVGQQASFKVEAYRDRVFPAEITEVRFMSETINNVVTYKALLKVDNADLFLRPGMTATADIVVDTVEAALLVPNAALRFVPPDQTDSQSAPIFGPPHMGPVTTAEDRDAARSVWVLRNDVPVEVLVTTGATDGRNTQILSGEITEGERVIVDAATAG